MANLTLSQSFLSLIFLVVVLQEIAANIQYAPEVTIQSGKIRGLVNKVITGSVRKYLAVPFAKAERFAKPEDPVAWKNVKDTIAIGNSCPQIPSGMNKAAEMSEDCLQLNVFVPEGVNGSSLLDLPVMVWIHGGAFMTGSNSIYDGTYIATLGKVIVVAINYRLNVFGFLATGKQSDLTGNYGMFDQIHALKWVKTNIEQFGGDPNKVTIFGESAGGASVSHLVISPLAKGLFHNAILQSGDATAMWAYQTYSEASQVAKLFGHYMGCTDIKALAGCLKKKTFKDIIAAVTKTSPFFPPVVGGAFLPADSPMDLLTREKIDVNVMIGFNNDDGSVSTNALRGGAGGFNVTNGVKRTDFEFALGHGKIKVLRRQNKLVNEAILYRYTDWSDVTDPSRNRHMLLDMFSDAMFLSPAVNSANTLAAKSVTVYMYYLQYRFDYFMTLRVPSWLKAYHGADIPIVFGFPIYQAKLTNSSVYTKDANFSRAAITLWTNFAKTGNPNTPDSVGIVWPQYDIKQQQFLALEPDMSVQSKLRSDYMAFWNSFIPAVLNTTTTPPKTTTPPTTSKPPKNVTSSGDTIAINGLTSLVLSIILTLYLVR